MFIPGSLGNVLPRAALPKIQESIWYPDEGPPDPTPVVDTTDAVGLNLGLQFAVSVPGEILSICYWRWSDSAPSNGTVGLWDADERVTPRTLIASKNFTGHTGTGWKKVDFDTPIPAPTTKSYFANIWVPESPDGNIHVGSTRYFFPTFPLYSENQMLWAWPNSGQPYPPHGIYKHNGWYKYGAFACPDDSVNSSNYWIDVVFRGSPAPAPPDPPIVIKWPIPAGYPNLENTGIPPGTVLTPLFGYGVATTADGDIIENLDIMHGSITVNHHNCTVRKCKVYYRGGYAIGIPFGNLGTIIEDCDLNSGFRANGPAQGIGGVPLAVRRCNIYRGENGIAHFGSYGDGSVQQVIEDNFIHSLRSSPGSPHYDCLQFNGGNGNILVRHNTFHNENTDTSAILIQNLFGPIPGIRIEDNILAGGGFTSYCVGMTEDPEVDPVIVQYYNNMFHIGAHGYLIDTQTDPDVRGNRYMDHGQIYDTEPPDGFTDGQMVRERFFGMPGGVQNVPGSVATDVVSGLTLGVSFQVSKNSNIMGVNIPKLRSPGETLTYKVGIWRFTGANRNAGTVLLHQETISLTTGMREGWEHLALATPVAVSAGQNILVGVWHPPAADGKVCFTVRNGIFGDNFPSQFGRAIAFNGAGVPLNGFTGGNGLFNYGPDLVPPLNQTGSRPSYNIDPIFEAAWSAVANIAPTATNLSTAEVYTEDTPLDLADIVITDPDSPLMAVALTLSNPAAGTLNTATSGSVTSEYNASTGLWTASGPIADVNALLAGLTFTPTANFSGSFSIATSVSDGVAPAITGTKAFTGTPVNDPPTATNLSTAEVYTEDTPLNLVNIVVTDIDSPNITATLTLSNPGAGSLNIATSGTVTSTYSTGTGVWTASGPIADVNVLLAGVTFTPTPNFSSNFSIATSVSDGVAPALTGSKAFTSIAVNDPPTATNLSTAETYTEDATLNLVNIVVSDADSPNVTATMTLSNPAAGRLSTATSGSVTSTYNAGTGVWTASGPIANVNTLLAGVSFVPAANFNSSFTIATSVSDGVATITGTKAFTGTPVNDPPTATNLSAADSYDVNTAVNLTNIVVTDIDSPNITATLTLSAPAAGSLNTATSGSVTSTYNAGTGVWTASGAIANVNTLLAGVTFTPAAGYNSNFTIATSVSDGVAPAITGSKTISCTTAPAGSIPLTYGDARFAGNTTSAAITMTNGTILQKSITDSGSTASIVVNGNVIIDTCRVDSAECVRMAGNVCDIRNSYLEATGSGDDHADTIQAYDPGQHSGVIKVTDTSIVAHTTAATAGLFIADDWGGTITLQNVCFNGGPFGLRVHADPGCTVNLSLTDVFFVGPFGFNAMLIEPIGSGVINITKWENVKNATIVGGVLVPGSIIPEP